MGQNLTPYVKILLIINLVIFAIINLGNIPLDLILGYHYPKSDLFQIYQPFTYMFVQRDFSHLFGNMFALFMFGPILENFLGSKKFLILYMFTGLGGGFLYGVSNYVEITEMEKHAAAYLMDETPENFINYVNEEIPYAYGYDQNVTMLYQNFPDDPENPYLKSAAADQVRKFSMSEINQGMIGASGAIFGILFTFAFLFPNLQLFLLFVPFPIKAKYLIGGYIGYEVYLLLQNNPTDSVAHLAHLGGALFAYILLKHWKYHSVQ